jgi:hypothetical protein
MDYERVIYTWGYSRNRTVQNLIAAAGEHMPVIDVRRSRGSRNPHWNEGAPEHSLGRYYEWYFSLGNTGKTGRWKPASEHYARAGILYCAWRLQLAFSIVLVCAEADHKRCHRTEVANEIAKIVDAEIVHL